MWRPKAGNYLITVSTGYAQALVNWLADVNNMRLVSSFGEAFQVWKALDSMGQFMRSVNRLKDASAIKPSSIFVQCDRCVTVPTKDIRRVCTTCGHPLSLSYL